MHAERIELTVAERDHLTEAAVMMVLLSDEHSPWSRAELEREVAGVSGNPLDVTDAINRLYAAKLVNLSGELVTPTRAARRMDELTGVRSEEAGAGPRFVRSLESIGCYDSYVLWARSPSDAQERWDGQQRGRSARADCRAASLLWGGLCPVQLASLIGGSDERGQALDAARATRALRQQNARTRSKPKGGAPWASCQRPRRGAAFDGRRHNGAQR